MTTDILIEALHYGLEQFSASKAPVCVLNASGHELEGWDKQSYLANISVKNTIKSDYNTILVRATRQTDETLGFLAMAVSHLAPNGTILIAQENRLGASSLERAASAGFVDVASISKFKCRILQLKKPKTDILKSWAAKAQIQKNPEGLWSAPGLFSWDRPDLGSQLLLQHLPHILTGAGADLGCGYGYLTTSLVKCRGVTSVTGVDLDSRAIECTRRNLEESDLPFAHDVLWRDVTTMTDLKNLDWVIMNPPFHTQLDEDRNLGQKFCNAALKMLKSGGNLYLVANRHMPYEAVLNAQASRVTVLADERGFKILHASV
ncbi:MAG TPA: class I SAM-dependent methyltransferase [Alphaproteobacteria bacterium]